MKTYNGLSPAEKRTYLLGAKMETKTYTYCGITAEAGLWHSLGMTAYSNTPFSENPNRQHHHAPSDGQLHEARIASGATDGRALVWLIQERRRSEEELQRNAALAKQGDDAIHAARINRQAAELQCKARGIKVE